jgi:hypothetical protein
MTKHYYEVTVPRVQRVVYKRTVVANSPEEAIVLARQPTAWPQSYDERVVERTDTGPWQAEEITDALTLRTWGDPNDPDAPFQVDSEET